MKTFCFALQHLTRINIYKGDFDEAAFGRAAVFFPLVGLLLGVLLLSAQMLLSYIFPVPLIAGMLVVLMVIMTGGMHLDGFMDTVDGVFSGRPRAMKLDIMRDSRVGAFGVLGLACLLLLKYNVFLTVAIPLIYQAILLASILSRWSMVYAIACFPYARKEGLGTLYNRYTGKRELFWATGSTIIMVALVAWAAGLILLLAAWGWVHLMGSRLTGDLGGLTGDIYGATAETTELLIYLAVIPLYGYCSWLFSVPWL
ncbi:adenosylcobinamide-GDP ribazoletransferase [Desulfoscipio gibsoniae]|uniref:Adenosylcobinamide-GDP ribazoletransferase n=1 Tax=Desulfoscipio gibsoniae DSM 7213 TaxID=767817 RepID=R4KDU0_9FIRM|nr:adenosylcobinamide-GDP ribazoletransferase [Desulfoscipio gibsoniae]AGL01343.1 cobalamin 5''-phosphate synthase/cobalamin synthase [Desulfoscipio gibsoniae DSM 7213]